MPNRILKESICCSENVEKLTLFQEVFFYRLIVNCDDFGRMDARPKILASKLFPLKDVRANQITDALRALTSAELITIYEKDGHSFLQMNTWDRHQTIRAKKSKYPAPDSNCKQLNADEINCMQMHADEINCKQMNSDASKCSRNPIQSVSISVSNPYPTRAGAQGTDTSDETFDSFWNEYPKKVAKQDAVKAWGKLKPDGELFMKIMAGLVRWKASDEWKRNDGQYIPHPATWINGKRWEDEVPVSSGRSERKVAATQYEQRDYSGQSEDLDAMLDFLAANRG